MRLGFYFKLAGDSMKRNGRLYGPYFLTCILMVAVYYIMHFLGYSGVMTGMAGGSTATDMMKLGTYVMTLFSAFFLFYTQSTLIKGRKKEFGLYSILGMNRANLSSVIFGETLITWGISLFLGLASGIALSKLCELGFTRMIAVPTKYSFELSKSSVWMTIVTFSAIFFLLFLNSMRQIPFSTAMELVRADKAGEKPPKANLFLSMIGLVFLGGGYYLALKIQQPMAALLWFFVAVIFVIIGTYILMVAGSVFLCKLLKKKESYYYQTKHFVSVSSMAYRMKRNGAGLASICILLTAVLVMLSSTSALYTGSEECLNVRYPNEIGVFACKYGYDENLVELGKKLEDNLKNKAREQGAKINNDKTFYEYSISGYFEHSKLEVNLNSKSNLAFIDYDHVAQILFIDVDDYNRIFGYEEVVGPGQALVGTAKKVEIGDMITIGELPFEVIGRIDDRIGEIDPAAKISACPGIFMLVNDVEEVASHFTQYKDYDGEPMLAWFFTCRFDTGLDEEGQISLAKTLDETMKEEYKEIHFDNAYCESHEGERDDFVSTFGGLFFLGILLSIIFLVSCVIIIYYKQVSEAFEDKSRFEIMQKVGMTKEEIRDSIDSQMFTVFLIPIAFACLHLIVVLPLINKLLMLFGLFNMPRLFLCALFFAFVCGICYAAVYRLTSRAYFNIVSA